MQRASPGGSKAAMQSEPFNRDGRSFDRPKLTSIGGSVAFLRISRGLRYILNYAAPDLPPAIARHHTTAARRVVHRAPNFWWNDSGGARPRARECFAFRLLPLHHRPRRHLACSTCCCPGRHPARNPGCRSSASTHSDYAFRLRSLHTAPSCFS
jgi:hypothetical protein